VAKRVADKIHNLDPPGRFMEWKKGNYQYTVASDAFILEAVVQAHRDLEDEKAKNSPRQKQKSQEELAKPTTGTRKYTVKMEHPAANADHSPSWNIVLDALSRMKPRTSAQSKEVVVGPHKFDVLFGRGNGISQHPGNVIYRQVCWMFKDPYVKAYK
jgi:hypothetical protein